MKKSFAFTSIACALLLTSCGAYQNSINNTVTTVTIPNSISSNTIVDLKVGERTSYRFTISDSDRLNGLDFCKRAATAALLKANGNAEVLVAPEYEYDSRMTYLIVTGRPATYNNFRSAK